MNPSALRGRAVLVLGLGESGLAMALWCARQGARVRVADTRAAPPGADTLAASAPDVELVCGAFAEALLDGIELVCISPGLSQREPVVVAARARRLPVTGEIELFAQALADLGGREARRVLAITGTNGKTTVTTLAGALGRGAGIDTEVCGNISPAALTALMKRIDAGRLPQLWVLELSSFQLETTDTLYPDAATVLNLSDDHLDRYDGLDDYAAAKARIFAGAGAQVLNREDARVAAMRIAGRRVFSFGLDAPAGEDDFGVVWHAGVRWLARGGERIMPAADLRMAGDHNIANALAALALGAAIGLPMAPMRNVLQVFRGLPHRVELVVEADGVAFYDDSKGTNVGATVAALAGLGRPAVLIAGGDGKGQDFTPLGPVVSKNARAVILIGRDAPAIEEALAGWGVPLAHARSMDDAVAQAIDIAGPGDAVLLSPACASLDMFRNYAHRAEVFVAAVRRLTGVRA